MVWWLLVVIGWKHWVMDHDGVGSRPRVMEQVLTMNVIPYNESHKTDLPSASFVRSPNCRDGTLDAAVLGSFKSTWSLKSHFPPSTWVIPFLGLFGLF